MLYATRGAVKELYEKIDEKTSILNKIDGTLVMVAATAKEAVAATKEVAAAAKEAAAATKEAGLTLRGVRETPQT